MLTLWFAPASWIMFFNGTAFKSRNTICLYGLSYLNYYILPMIGWWWPCLSILSESLAVFFSPPFSVLAFESSLLLSSPSLVPAWKKNQIWLLTSLNSVCGCSTPCEMTSHRVLSCYTNRWDLELITDFIISCMRTSEFREACLYRDSVGFKKANKQSGFMLLAVLPNMNNLPNYFNIVNGLNFEVMLAKRVWICPSVKVLWTVSEVSTTCAVVVTTARVKVSCVCIVS